MPLERSKNLLRPLANLCRLEHLQHDSRLSRSCPRPLIHRLPGMLAAHIEHRLDSHSRVNTLKQAQPAHFAAGSFDRRIRLAHWPHIDPVHQEKSVH